MRRWNSAILVLAWLAFALVALGCGVGAFLAGGGRGSWAVGCFAVSAICSLAMAAEAFRRLRRERAAGDEEWGSRPYPAMTGEASESGSQPPAE